MNKKLNLGSKTNKQRIAKSLILSIIIVISFGTMAFASGNTYATNASNWLMDGVKTIALCVVSMFAIKFIVKRQVVQSIVFFIGAAIILVIIIDPTKLVTIGQYIFGVIFG